jgi:hypothetical protein
MSCLRVFWATQACTIPRFYHMVTRRILFLMCGIVNIIQYCILILINALWLSLMVSNRTPVSGRTILFTQSRHMDWSQCCHRQLASFGMTSMLMNVLLRTKLERRDMVLEISFDDSKEQPWHVQNERSYVQGDGVSCGPIACVNSLTPMDAYMRPLKTWASC